MQSNKVMIIGAGPSGISAALSLNKLGNYNITIIDKDKFPRYKCCAGYITNKTRKMYQEFGLNISKSHYSLIDDFKIYYKYKNRQTIKNKFLYTNRNIDRVELDYHFFKLLKKNNIKVLEKITISKIDYENNKITLSNNKEYLYDYLIFADGTSGYGSSLVENRKKNIALQSIFPSSREDGIEIHFGITKRGYAWISTLNGITNVGITDIYNKNINYREVLKDFIKKNHLEDTNDNINGAFTPIGVVQPIYYNNVYLVGDEAGCCDPFTLSGLRYALKSGMIVADSIHKKDNRIYTKYIKKLGLKFKFMYILERIFYIPLISFLVFNVGCTIFKPIISYLFNHFFVNKK